MQKSQKLTASILLVACITYSLFFPDSVNTALVFVLYACLLMYLFSKRELPVLSRMKIMIAAFMFSMLMTAVCIAAAELLRGYFLFDGLSDVSGYGSCHPDLFLILQEFLPDVVQVVLLVLAGLYLINIGVLSAMMFSTLSNIGLTGANTEYILPWDLLGIALCIVLAEGVLFAGIHRLRLYFQSR